MNTFDFVAEIGDELNVFGDVVIHIQHITPHRRLDVLRTIRILQRIQRFFKR